MESLEKAVRGRAVMAIRRAYKHFRLQSSRSWQFISHPRFKRWVGVLMMGTLLLLLIIGFLSPIQVADANDDVLFTAE